MSDGDVAETLGEIVEGEDDVVQEEPAEELENSSANGSTLGADDGENDLETIRKRVKEMEEEAEKIRAMQSEVEKQMNMSTTSTGTPSSLNQSMEEKMEVDTKSIYVGNVDYGATAEELEAHFHGCGSINRVTILCDKFSGHPKGFAYIEFADKDSVQTAVALDESLFRGRQIKVSAKRTNKPGISTTNRGRGRGAGRGGRGAMTGYRGGFRGRGRGMFTRLVDFRCLLCCTRLGLLDRRRCPLDGSAKCELF